MKTCNFNSATALVVVGSGGLIFLATHSGVAVFPDVVYYVGGAREILSEGRYVLPTFLGAPILNYPPPPL